MLGRITLHRGDITTDTAADAIGPRMDAAARIALVSTTEALDAHPEVAEVRFWLLDAAAYETFERAAGSLSTDQRKG